MQVQALPGASLHDGRERVECEGRGESCLSASVTDVLVPSDRTLVVVKCRVKLPGSRTTPGRCRVLLSTERYHESARKTVGIKELREKYLRITSRLSD